MFFCSTVYYLIVDAASLTCKRSVSPSSGSAASSQPPPSAAGIRARPLPSASTANVRKAAVSRNDPPQLPRVTPSPIMTAFAPGARGSRQQESRDEEMDNVEPQDFVSGSSLLTQAKK